ncbi:tyrosine-type recombinase/integrase [Aureimonas ureilytica]|uniref:tyrosine-type recombinase/integrase n=1 Tax=Aureimonas ureilytica TaxID=401562 RepID=UPI00037CCF47|nr:site-specific integrase [Aureimonas ureilytica]
MSVFKRAGSEVYSYDFRYRGRRLSGTTDCTTRRAAEAFERQVKDEAKRDQLDTSKPLTFQAAAFLYWNEVGQYHSDPSGPERNIAWLQAEIGANTLLSDITNATVARLVAKRRGEGVANGTVNRTVVEPLRTILRRAVKMNGAKVQAIDWIAHRLKEPQERVREASAVEEEAVLKVTPEDYRPLIRFAIMTGCRRAEIVGLTWQDVNWFAREFRVTGKGERSRTIPMTAAVYDLLFSLKDHHKTAVFTFKAARTRAGRVKGKRYPITAEGLHTIWHRYIRAAVPDFRFHDTRHTAATRLVRTTGNLKMAQKLLGHTNVTTTARYAHVTHDDLRLGLEAVDAAGPETQRATVIRKVATP